MIETWGRCRKGVLVLALRNQLFSCIFTCFLGVKLRVLGSQHGADSLTPCFKTANGIFGDY